MAAPRTRLPCILLTLLLATAAVNKHEDPHEHAAALKKREVNSRHADAGKKQVKVTFTNYLPVAGGHRLWWDGGVGRQHQADLGYVKQTYIAGTFEGHRWWVENEDGETVWQMVVDEGKGYNQHVAISKDRSVKRTISSIIEHPELYDLHRLDSDYGAKHDHHGCADPVLVDDVVRVRAIGSEGAPAWVAQEDGLLSAAHDSRTMNHQIWKVESDRTAGPLWTGDYIYFLGEGALPLVGPPATCSWSCCVYTENRTPPLWKLPTGVPLGPSEPTHGYSPPVPPSGCCLKLSQAMDDVTYQWLLSSAQR